ncbi:hypothetical protein [Streptomyces sp. ODS28]|uniref:hypothetical protein n=1 Tax=Streptomyces sp. ODS28 TaxID=3136688 RepID=UPI0031E6FA58
MDRRTFVFDSAAIAAAAALHVPPGTTNDIVKYFQDQLRGHVQADGLIGPQQVLPTVVQQAGTLAGLASGATGKGRKQLWQTTAAYGIMTSWLYRVSGATREGRQWGTRMIDLAHRGDEPQLVAHALVNRAMVEADRGDGRSTLEFAASAVDNERRMCPKIRVQALQAQAHGYALIGDRAGADIALNRAEPLVDKIHDGYPWGLAVGGARYLDAQRATCYTRLRLGSEAAALWPDIIADRRVGVRDRAVFTARYAASLADAKQPEAAVAALQDAVPSAAVGSGRLRTELLTAWDRLEPWRYATPGKQARRVLADIDLL